MTSFNLLSGAHVEKESFVCTLRAQLEPLGPGGQISIQGRRMAGAQSRHPVTWVGTKLAIARGTSREAGRRRGSCKS